MKDDRIKPYQIKLNLKGKSKNYISFDENFALEMTNF